MTETIGAPEVGPDAAAKRGAARGFSDTDQGVAHKQKIAPRHRGVIRRYFNKKSKKEEN